MHESDLRADGTPRRFRYTDHLGQPRERVARVVRFYDSVPGVYPGRPAPVRSVVLENVTPAAGGYGPLETTCVAVADIESAEPVGPAADA
jgi:hypothetical protein